MSRDDYIQHAHRHLPDGTDPLSPAPWTPAANLPFVAAYAQLEYDYTDFPNFQNTIYIDWNTDSVNNSSYLSSGDDIVYGYVGGGAFENDFFKTDWTSEIDTAFTTKKKGLYYIWCSWNCIPAGDMRLIPSFWTHLSLAGTFHGGVYLPLSILSPFDIKYHATSDLPDPSVAGPGFAFETNDVSHFYSQIIYVDSDRDIRWNVGIRTSIDFTAADADYFANHGTTADNNTFMYTGAIKLAGISP